MKIRNVSREMVTFMLEHDVVCAAGECRCTVYRKPGTIREIRLPDSLMIASGHEVTADEVIGTLPAVLRAVDNGQVQIMDECPPASVEEPVAPVEAVEGDDVPANKRTRRTSQKVRL